MRSGRGCDNLSLAFATAESRLRDDGGDVLLVTADQVVQGSRLNQDARTVMSDGAASCLLSRKSSGPSFRALAASTTTVSPPADAPPLLRARHHMSALRTLSEQLFTTAGLTPEHCATVVTSNVELSVAHMFRSAAGAARVPLYRPAAEDIGHCFAADGIHTLGALLKSGTTRVGHLVLTVATSPYSCSLMLLAVAATSS